MLKLLRFKDLRDLGIVNNRVTLARWIEHEGFPPGRLLGPNSRAYPSDDVDTWLTDRAQKTQETDKSE